jgi:cell shape-determining protein MreD
MTRQDQIIKWLVYALGLLPVWVLDAFVLGRYPLLGVRPNLLPLAVVAVAVLEGATAGAGFGLGVGLVWALGYPGASGGMVLFLVLAGALCGAAAQYALTQGFAGCLLCSAGTLAALEGLHLLWGLFIQEAAAAVLLEVAGKEFLWTLVWTPVVYLIFRFVFRKVGLDRLA